MFWDDAEGRDELGRMGLLANDCQPERNGLAVMALVSEEEPEVSGGDPFSLEGSRHIRFDRTGCESDWLSPGRLLRPMARYRIIG
jgi:hypothetical protein